MDNRLVEISDLEVLINFTPNTKCRANIRLRSLCATSPVAFKVQTSSPHKFLVNPPSGLIPPFSHTTLQIILKPQNQVPSAFPRSPSDRFLIKTAVFDSDESVNSWFLTVSDGSTQDVKLKVAFVGPFLLKHAVANGDLNAVRNIIKRQKLIFSELTEMETESLIRVVSELANSNDMLNLLLQAGLRIHTVVNSDSVCNYNHGTNELHAAVWLNRTEEVLSLIKKKEKYGSLGSRDKEGMTPLHVAVSKGNIQCAKILLEFGADKNTGNKNGLSPLHIAAVNADRGMVEMLMQTDADPTIMDNRGRSPVDIARAKGHTEIVEILERGEELLMAARRGDLKRLEELLDRGATTNYSDQYGLTALHAAAIKGNKDVILLLLRKMGVDLEMRDRDGHAPLHLAVESGSLETVVLLIDSGVDVNAKSKSGATPLDVAQAMGYDGISQLLSHKGAFSTFSCSLLS